MFGPNTTGSFFYNLSYSHRDKEFKSIFEKLRLQFQIKFNLYDYDLLFIAGSGTIGIESVISSCNRHVNLLGASGKFKDRWSQLSRKYEPKESSNSIDMFCQLETSCSKTFYKTNSIIDAISSFPYYELPEDTPIFITCPNKQLGAFPGVSIVAVRKDSWSLIRESEEFSYLNLFLHKKYSENSQTLTTAPTPVFEHLLHCIENLDVVELRNKIDLASELVVNAVGAENIIGQHKCPVITFKKDSIRDTIAEKYELYGVNNSSSDYYQVFTYSHPIRDYEKFAMELIHEGN